MKRFVAVLMFMLLVGVGMAVADETSYSDRGRVMTITPFLTTSCTDYVITTTTSAVTTIAANPTRIKIEIYNTHASTAVVYSCGVWSTAQTMQTKTGGYLYPYVATSSNHKVVIDSYRGAIKLCTLSPDAGVTSTTVTLRVVEYYKP